MSFFDGASPATILIYLFGGAVMLLLVFFRGHFIWYRELRGGLWVEMKSRQHGMPYLWRKKGSRWLGIWRGWSNWYETGIYYKTRRNIKDKQEPPEPWPVAPWPEGSTPGITKEARRQAKSQ